MTFPLTFTDFKKMYVGKPYENVKYELVEYAKMKRMHIGIIEESTGFAPVKIDYEYIYVRNSLNGIIEEIFVEDSY